jgi:amino acid transporter
MIAVITYCIGLIAVYAVQAFVTQEILAGFGITAPWQICFLVQLLLVTVLAYRKIDLSARVTFVIVALELLVLLALVAAVVAQKGLAAFPLEAVSPSVMGIGPWVVAFVFAILCYQGFEAGALYAPEAKNPERTVPRALYGALIILTASFAIIAWVLTGVTGVDALQDTVGADPAGFIFTVMGTYLGDAGIWALSVLALLAQLACTLAYTNFTSRYLNSLSGEELLPAFLNRKNHHNSPGTAILGLSVLVIIAVLGLSVLGIDPYTEIAPVGFGLGALGATTLQALASAAVVGYFLRQPPSERHWWKTTVAPIAATILLAAALYIELISFSFITGQDTPEMLAVPWAIPLTAILGIAFGFWLRRNRPHTYLSLAAGDTAEDAAEIQRQRNLNRSGAAPEVPELAGEK